MNSREDEEDYIEVEEVSEWDEHRGADENRRHREWREDSRSPY